VKVYPPLLNTQYSYLPKSIFPVLPLADLLVPYRISLVETHHSKKFHVTWVSPAQDPNLSPRRCKFRSMSRKEFSGTVAVMDLSDDAGVMYNRCY
jgi:hypothetical protein